MQCRCINAPTNALVGFVVSAPYRYRMRLGFLVALGLVGGLALGLVLAIALADDNNDSAGDSHNDGGEALPEGQQTSPELQVERTNGFLEDWTRFRTAEALVVSDLTRVTADGQELVVNEVLAQRPGDRLIRSLSGVTGYLGGVQVFCATATTSVEDGDLECRDVAGAKSIDEALAKERATMKALLEGDPPPYRIFVTPAGCWELLLTTETFDAPFGETSTYCFDDVTGTLKSLETTFNNGLVETTTAVNVRTEVTDDDLLALLNQSPRG